MPDWSLDDWIFFGRFLDFATVFLAAILIAWQGRVYQPKELAPKSDTFKVMGIPFVRAYDRQYEEEVYLRDMLTDEDADILRRLLTDQIRLSFRGAHDYDQTLTRPRWRQIREAVVKSAMGEYADNGELQVRANLYNWLGVPLPQHAISQDTEDLP